MKITASFRLRHAILALALLSTASAFAQDDTGNKPEIVAQQSAPNSTMAAHAHAVKVVSTSLAIALGDKTLTLTPADLAALPHETVTVVNGHTNATETYGGVPIAALLARLGLPFEKANEHTLLKTILIAEGTDGYRIIVSTYETLSTIRGTSAIVADTLDGKPLISEGVFKLVIPGDKRPQRWVQNLKSITFKTLE